MAGSVASMDAGAVASADARLAASGDAGSVPWGVPGPGWVDCPHKLADVIKLPFFYVPVSIPFEADTELPEQVERAGPLVRRVLFLAAHKYFVVVGVRPESATSRFPLDTLHSTPLFGVPEHLPDRHLILEMEDGAENGGVEEYLLQNAALVIGGSADVMIRAMLYNRPILALEPGWYSGKGIVQEVEGLEALHSSQVDVASTSQRRKAIDEWARSEVNGELLAASAALKPLLEEAGLMSS